MVLPVDFIRQNDNHIYDCLRVKVPRLQLIAMQTTLLGLKSSEFYHQKFKVTLYAWHIYPETMQQRMFSALFCEVFMWKLFRQFLLTTLIARHYCRFNHLKSEHENLRRLVTNATMIYNVSFSLPRSVWTLKYQEITCSRYKCSTGFMFIIVANFSKHSAH